MTPSVFCTRPVGWCVASQAAFPSPPSLRARFGKARAIVYGNFVFYKILQSWAADPSCCAVKVSLFRKKVKTVKAVADNSIRPMLRNESVGLLMDSLLNAQRIDHT